MGLCKIAQTIEFSLTHGVKTYIEIEMSTSINMNSGEIIHPASPFNNFKTKSAAASAPLGSSLATDG